MAASLYPSAINDAGGLRGTDGAHAAHGGTFRAACPPARAFWLANDWAKIPIGLICLVLAMIITLPIPPGHVAPGSAIWLLALGFMERDGVVIGIGFAAAALALVIVTVASAGAVNAVHHRFMG